MPDEEIFREGDPDRGYVEWADSFQDCGPATGQRIILVRAGFMEALVEDPRVLHHLGTWLERLRAYAHLEAAAPGETPVPEFGDDGVQLVREELGLHWPWVFASLLWIVNRMVTLQIDEPAKALPPLGEYTVFAPPFTIEVRDGIPIDEVEDMLRDLLLQLKQLKAEARKGDEPGKAPRADGTYLRTWGRWYYQHMVKRPPTSVRALAAAHHVADRHPGPFEDHDCRKAVRRAIAEAGRLLNLGRYKF